MIWARTASANLPLRMATDAKLVPWPAPEDGCECSHRSSASDHGLPSPAATKLHSRVSEECASSAPALWSVAFSTPAVPTGRVSRFGHSGVGPARAGFGIIGNDHRMDFGAVSHVGGASSEAGPDRPTVRGTGRGSYIGPAAVTERKKLISSGFLLQSTPHIPRPDYGTISSMHGGLGVAAAENRLRISAPITR